MAAARGHLDCVNALLEAKDVPWDEFPFAESGIFFAALNGQQESIHIISPILIIHFNYSHSYYLCEYPLFYNPPSSIFT